MSQKAGMKKKKNNKQEQKEISLKKNKFFTPSTEINSAKDQAEDRYEVFEREDKSLINWLVDNPKEVIKERQNFLQQLQKKRCTYGYGGAALPITLSPVFLKKETIKLIAHVGEVLDRVLDKVIKAFRNDSYVRSYLLYPDVPVAWLDWDPGYEKPTVLSRHDALFNGKDLKFIEFNCDNPGARGWTDTYEALYKESPLYKDFINEFAVNHERRMLKLLKKCLLDCYKEYGGTKSKPRIALVSFKEFLPNSDNEIIRDYLIEHGLEANFMDARDLEYKNKGLYSNNVQMDIINLTLRFTFFKRFPREMKDFMQGAKNRGACFINPLKAIIGSQKEMLSFITNEANFSYFTRDEQQIIKKHLPWTRKLDETVTISIEGQDISLKEYVLKNRERLVLKPTAEAGGTGVYVGKTTEKGEWEHIIENTMGCQWWIIQEAVDIPQFEFPVLKNNKIVMEKKYLNLNPYIYKGDYAGCLGRVSDCNVINVSSGGGLVPIFELK
ncbi:hypothetical protein ACFL35_05845 [Candidatus Riflebacteria bacterium]